MATRTIWQDVYTVQFDKNGGGNSFSNHMSAADPTYAAAQIGIQGTGSALGKFAMPLNDHPNYKAPSGNLETEQATGIATRRKSEYNIVQTGEAVQFNLPQNGDAYNTSLFVQLLFQYGYSTLTVNQMTGMFIDRGAPYSSADTKFFAQFVRHLQPSTGSDAIDLLVKGGICHTLTVSGETGGLLTIEPTIYGAKWEQKNLSGIVNTAADSFADITPLKFQDSTFAILDIDYDNPVEASTFQFTDKSGISPDAGSTLALSGTDFTDIYGDNTNKGFSDGEQLVVTRSNGNDGVYNIASSSGAANELITLQDGEFHEFADFPSSSGGTNEFAVIYPAKWHVVNTPSVSLTFTNNCQFNYYNDDEASNAIVGRLTVEGTFSMPFGTATVGKNEMINKFLNGQEFQMAWYWGQSGASVNVGDDHRLQPSATMDRLKNDSSATSTKNYVSFVICARITDYEVSGDNELMIDVTFQGVTTDWSDAMRVYAAYDSSYLDRIK